MNDLLRRHYYLDTATQLLNDENISQMFERTSLSMMRTMRNENYWSAHILLDSYLNLLRTRCIELGWESTEDNMESFYRLINLASR